MKFIILAAIVVLGLSNLTDALTISCVFKVDLKTKLYACEAKIVFTGDMKTVDKITGWHLKGKRNSDVKQISIVDSKETHFFPKGLSKYFMNIIKIIIRGTSINEVSKDDLSGLPITVDVDFDKEQNEKFEKELDNILADFNQVIENFKPGTDDEKLYDLLGQLNILLIEFDIEIASDSITDKLTKLLTDLTALIDKIEQENSTTVTASTTTTTTTTTTKAPTAAPSTTTTTAATTTKGSGGKLSFAEQLKILLEALEKTITKT